MKKIFLILVFALLASCTQNEGKELIGDFKLFENSKAHELALAVQNQETAKISSLVKKGIDVDTVEPKFGQTLLMLAVQAELNKSVEALLKNKANPNKQDNIDGDSALMLASGFGLNYNKDQNILNLLLKYGGNPNDEQKGKRKEGNLSRENPLTIASSCCFEKVKSLVESGADIDYNNEFNMTPLKSAIYGFKDKEKIVEYLLIEKSADFNKCYTVKNNGDTLKITNLLRNWRFKLDSEQYKTKMKIVDYLESKGENYWETPIPKKFYKIHDEEYLKKY